MSAYNAGDQGLIPGSGRSPEKERTTHSSTLAWKIPWMEEPGGLQSMGLQSWIRLSDFTFSTLLLTYAYMPALPASPGVFPASTPGMDSHRLPHDQPIFDQLPHLLMGVGIGDFISLTGVQPDLLFATKEDSGGKPLLKSKHTHGCSCSSQKKNVFFFTDELTFMEPLSCARSGLKLQRMNRGCLMELSSPSINTIFLQRGTSYYSLSMIHFSRATPLPTKSQAQTFLTWIFYELSS